MIVEVILIAATIALLWYIKDYLTEKKNTAPGPPKLPYIGNLLQIAALRPKSPVEIYEILSKKYGSIMSIKLGALDQLVINDYETMKEVLCSEIWVNRHVDDELKERRSFNKSLGLIFANGEVWKEMRRFSIRTLRDFGFGKQKSMETYLNEEIAELMKRMDKEAKKTETVAMKQFFTVSVLNILWTMLAGYRFTNDDKRLIDLIDLIEQITRGNAIGSNNVVMAFPILRYIYDFTEKSKTRQVFFQKMHSYFRDVLNERRAEGGYKENQKDFIDVFINEIDKHKEDKSSNNYYTDEQFIIVCFDLFVAGSETTANTMEFAILSMILNPEVQKKVQKEIDSVVGNSRLPSTLDRPNMPYTEATLLEVQRMASVLPVIVRAATQDTKIGNYHVNKGTVGVMNILSWHNNKDEWKDPEIFKPERFLDDNQNVINAHKILPFGLGKRICLGEVLAKATMFGFFTALMQRYTFQVAPDHPTPSYKPMMGFTLSPHPYHVVVKQRVLL